MTFRATNIVPSDAYNRIKRAATNLRSNAIESISTLAAGDVPFSYIRSVYLYLYNADVFFDDLKTTPGLVAYASAQEDDPTYDVAAEFNTMQAAMAAAITWLNANVPSSVTAVEPEDWPTTEGTETIATEFTPAQTAVLRTRLQAIVDTIT